MSETDDSLDFGSGPVRPRRRTRWLVVAAVGVLVAVGAVVVVVRARDDEDACRTHVVAQSDDLGGEVVLDHVGTHGGSYTRYLEIADYPLGEGFELAGPEPGGHLVLLGIVGARVIDDLPSGQRYALGTSEDAPAYLPLSYDDSYASGASLTGSGAVTVTQHDGDTACLRIDHDDADHSVHGTVALVDLVDATPR